MSVQQIKNRGSSLLITKISFWEWCVFCYICWNLVVVVWWSEASLLLQNLDNLTSLMEPKVSLSESPEWEYQAIKFEFKFKHTRVKQQENATKRHIYLWLSQKLKNKRPCQSLEFNQIQILLYYLKKSCSNSKTSNVAS